MVNMTIVNNEQCVVGTTHTPHTVDKPTNTKGVCRVTCVLAGLRAHYTTHAIPQEKEKKSEEERRETRENREKRVESSVRRWRRSSR